MKSSRKTRQQLIEELQEAQRQLAEQSAFEVELTQDEPDFHKPDIDHARMFELFPIGVTVVDMKGVVSYCNSAVYERSGFTRDDYIGKHFSKMASIRVKDVPKFVRLFNSILRGKTPEPFEVIYKRKDGTTGWTEVSISTLKIGGVRRIIVIQHDVTERKRIEEMLHVSEAHLAEAQHIAHIGSWDWHIETNLLVWSDEMHRIFGIDRGQFGENYEAFLNSVHPDDREYVNKSVHNALYENKPYDLEYRIILPNGSERNIHAQGRVTFDNSGKPIRMIGTVNDITERKRAEETLAVEVVRRHILVDESLDGIVVLDEDAAVIEANRRFAEMLGYSPEEVLKLHTWDWDREYSRQELLEMGRNIGPEGLRLETRHRRKDGTYFDVDISINKSPVAGQDLIFCVCRDITLRKEAEEALRESEERYRTLVEGAIIGIMNVDLSGKITYVNNTILEATGYTREEMVGKNGFKLGLVPRDIIKLLRQRMKEKLLGEPPGRLEFQFKRKDGKWVWLQIRGSLLRVNKIPVGIQIIGEDITEYKQAEEALSESEEKFTKAFRSSPDDIVVTRLSDGTFLEVNESFVRTTGYSREEIIGRTSVELGIWARPGDRDLMLKLLTKKGRVNNEEYKLRTKSGEIRVMLFSAEPISFGGHESLLVVSRDITELRKIEAQAREAEYFRELDKLRTELLANISHELRTPLASIKGFATMLLEYEDKLERREKRDYLETIDKNTDRLVELIEQLLEMSRLEAGMLSIDKKPTSISKLCREAITEAQVRSAAHKFTLDMPGKIPRVKVDGRRVRQVLDNIIDNSIKYSEDGTEVNLTLRRQGPELIFTIADHGTGIPPQDLPRVFNRMFHATKKTGVAGAGLGLSICKGLVETHGGRIWIESEEGKGTSCFFTLPLDSRNGVQA